MATQIFSLVAGQVTTYGEIAEAINSSPQPVGQAVAWLGEYYRNLNEEFPDHRVLISKFRLQPAYPGGRDEQRRKLEGEGVRFRQVHGGSWRAVRYQ